MTIGFLDKVANQLKKVDYDYFKVCSDGNNVLLTDNVYVDVFLRGSLTSFDLKNIEFDYEILCNSDSLVLRVFDVNYLPF